MFTDYHHTQAQMFRAITHWVDCQQDLANHQNEEPPMAPRWKPWKKTIINKNRALRIGKKERALAKAESTARPLLPEIVEVLLDQETCAQRHGDTPYKSTRHVFHSEVLDSQVLPRLAAAVSKNALETKIGWLHRQVRGLSTNVDLHAGDVPELAALLTPQAAETYIRNRATHYAEVASDPEIRVIENPNGPGDDILEHVASGTAIRLWVSTERPGFGSLVAGRHKVFRGEPLNSDHLGLGIGRRLYKEAAARYPDVRWASQATNEHSAGVRRALHAEDPWRWESGSCVLCREERGWRGRGPSDFADHAK